MSAYRVSYDQLHRLRTLVNRLIDEVLGSPVGSSGEWHPPLDLVEGDEAFEVELEVPGLDPTCLQVEFHDQTLVIRGRKERMPDEPPPRRFFLAERFVGAFQVEVEVPGPVNPRLSRAHLASGVLTVVLPRVTDQRHRVHSIPISEETSDDE